MIIGMFIKQFQISLSLSLEESVRLCVDCGLCLFCWFIVQDFTIESNLWNLCVLVACGRGIGHCCYLRISSTKLKSFSFYMFNMILIGQLVAHDSQYAILHLETSGIFDVDNSDVKNIVFGMYSLGEWLRRIYRRYVLFCCDFNASGKFHS